MDQEEKKKFESAKTITISPPGTVGKAGQRKNFTDTGTLKALPLTPHEKPVLESTEF